MKTRTIPELLQVMLDNEEYFEEGLCVFNGTLYEEKIFNISEFNLVQSYLKGNLPIAQYISPRQIGKTPRYCFEYYE